MKRKFGQSMLLLTALTLIQKGIGFLREVVMAYFYGTSVVTDALSMANSASEIVMGFTTAFSMIFLPLYSQYVAQQGRSSGDRFMNQILTLVSCFGTVLGLTAVLFAEPIISFVAPGFSGIVYAYSVLFFRFSVWAILLQAVSGILLNYLNYQEAFIPGALAGLVVSPIQMLILVISVRVGESFISQMLLLSNLSYVGVLYLICRRFGFRSAVCLTPTDRFRPVFRMVLPIFAGNAISYMNLTVDKIFGSQLESGSVSSLEYAFNIRTMLVTVFTAALTTIIFPMLSKAAAKDDWDTLRQVTAKGVELITILFFPLTIAVMLLARPLLILFYGGGVFDETSVRLTSGALFFYSIGLWPVALREYLTRVYYSIQKTKALPLVWLTTMAVNITGDFLLVGRYGVNGLALATSLSVLAASAVLYLLLRHYLRGPYIRKCLSVMFRSLSASAAMGAVVYAGRQYILPLLGTQKLWLLVFLGGTALIGSVIYFLLLMVLHVEAATELLQPLLRRKHSS